MRRLTSVDAFTHLHEPFGDRVRFVRDLHRVQRGHAVDVQLRGPTVGHGEILIEHLLVIDRVDGGQRLPVVTLDDARLRVDGPAVGLAHARPVITVITLEHSGLRVERGTVGERQYRVELCLVRRDITRFRIHLGAHDLRDLQHRRLIIAVDDHVAVRQ